MIWQGGSGDDMRESMPGNVTNILATRLPGASSAAHSRQFDVGVDVRDFQPVRLAEIIWETKPLRKRPEGGVTGAAQ
jgi:hypothetical protein